MSKIIRIPIANGMQLWISFAKPVNAADFLLLDGMHTKMTTYEKSVQHELKTRQKKMLSKFSFAKALIQQFYTAHLFQHLSG